MPKFIFLFKHNHPLRNHFQTVYAPDKVSARRRMLERYGHIGFHYTEKEWEEHQNRVKAFGLQTKRELAPIYCREEAKDGSSFKFNEI